MDRFRCGADLRGAGGRCVRERRRQQQTEGLSQLHHRCQYIVGLGQPRLCRLRFGRSIPVFRSIRRAGGHNLCAKGGLPAERRLRDEPQDAGRDPQVQGYGRCVSVAAARRRRAGAHR
jgi:hypothetical protein